jgi:transposase
MRGQETQQTHLFYQLSYERILPETHPLRHIRRVVDQVMAELEGVFQQMYAKMGRPSIPPERLLRPLLVEVLYSIRSDRQLVERLRYDLLLKWFVGLDLEEDSWDASTFSQNRDRLMQYDVSRLFFDRVLKEAHRGRLLSQKHFTVDGTLIQAWASIKSVRPIDEDEDVRPRMVDAIQRGIFTENAARTRRINRRPIRRRGCSARATITRPCRASWVMS